MNVGQAFLHHTENRCLRLSWQTPEILGKIQVDSNFAAQRETIDVPAKSGRQAGFVEQWRMQQVRNRAHFGGHLVNQVFTVGQSIRRFGQALDVAAHRREIHAQRRQHLAHAIVQFARDAPPFFVLHLEQSG